MFNLIVKSSFRFLFSVFFLCIVSSSNAQNTEGFLPNITPPSPVAGELGKYGNVPVGLFTGAPNLSIPLLNFKTKNLESPISLSYGSNGIKVDEVASNVGLGWNLIFGGVITRTVRDQNDDNQRMVYPPDDMPNPSPDDRLQFYRAAGQEFADTEKDIYSFNFNGNSGKFIYDKNNVPVLVNNQKIKIERTGTNNADFLLTTANGIRYYFTEKETTAFRSQGAGHSIISASVTAWYLTQLVHPNGSVISLVYENTFMDYTASNSQTLTMAFTPGQTGCGRDFYVKAPTLSGIVAHEMSVVGKRIKKIYSNNSKEGYITFTYFTGGINAEVEGDCKIETLTHYNESNQVIEKVSFNYLKTANGRVFLQNFTFLDPSKKYSFEYINQSNFPKRLSASQDHWGYYNGKSNSNLIPKNISGYGVTIDETQYSGADKEPYADFAKTGMLSKVIYPAKGYTEFDYEGNTYWGEQTTYPARKSDNYVRGTDDNDDTPVVYTMTSPIDQRVEMYGLVTYVSPNGPPKYDKDGNIIPDPLDTGHDIASVLLKCRDCTSSGGSFFTYSQFGTQVSHSPYNFIRRESNIFYFNAKAGKTYEFHFFKGGINTKASLKATYYATAPVKTDTNIPTGGVRIKTTKDFSGTGIAAGYKRYYYGPKDDLNHSSGNKGKMPLYMDKSVRRVNCPPGDGQMGTACWFADYEDLVVSSSSIISLFDTGSSNCFYKYVTVSEGGDNFENGGEMKEFKIHRDVDGALIVGNVDIKSAPLTNLGWDNGLELKSQIFKKKASGDGFITIAESENTYKLDPSYGGEVRSFSVRKNFNDPCGVAQYAENLSIVEYKTKLYWHYLEYSISKKYDLDGLNPVETQTVYKYGNPSHIQLTSQSTKSSLKENLETRYYYPHDLLSEPFVSEMIAGNRIDTPLKTETYRGTVKQSEQKTVFGKDASTADLLLPKFIYTAKAAAALEKKITFGKYDEKGNILEYTPENGTPVSIIWGYNKTQPIAKIENALYSQAASYAANLQDKSDTKTETELKEALGLFRTALPNAMITTYTYKPLVGVSTVTDPKGQTTTYTYDDFGRLDVVKDAKGNILSENQYRYKQ
ncbi:RHS repeat domain-containing protein [Flavobacterium gelatinilyticum]|uniref:RHS repeat domain-containing protein n=1 Tax=Flavobacterium gelatinilyticum TaxID=3003260 RepID=UPI002480B286|nr:RHS repeat domain-containing protein [Flavobacterium gelatinilyticum]